jgi:hypothetical protein
MVFLLLNEPDFLVAGKVAFEIGIILLLRYLIGGTGKTSSMHFFVTQYLEGY